MINPNARDAVHVIDGLLHHETDLHIEEHSIRSLRLLEHK
ncbi:transposase [Bacillus cereus]|nr:transposase [Bacillus cereus]KYQ03512.1 transposase [Bacillus cereus]